MFLPPYSPELQAVEGRWLVLQGDRELLRRHTLFHWWPGAKGLA
ncbi:transposase [Thermus tengchongensis]|nr:transposase [Thermus tengchongensis]